MVLAIYLFNFLFCLNVTESRDKHYSFCLHISFSAGRTELSFLSGNFGNSIHLFVAVGLATRVHSPRPYSTRYLRCENLFTHIYSPALAGVSLFTVVRVVWRIFSNVSPFKRVHICDLDIGRHLLSLGPFLCTQFNFTSNVISARNKNGTKAIGDGIRIHNRFTCLTLASDRLCSPLSSSMCEKVDIRNSI